LKNYKGFLLLALALASINIIFSLLDPQIIRLLIDNYATKISELSREEFIQGVLILLVAFVGVSFISRIAKNFQDYFVSSITQHVGTDMYAQSVDHTFSLPYSIFEDQRSGEVLQKLQKARLDTQALISSLVNILFLAMIGMLFVIIYSFFVHWAIAVTFIISIPLLGIFIYSISGRIRESQKEIVKESAELAGATTFD